MPSIHIPPQAVRRWTGLYQGSYYGTIWKTFNVDLDREEGKVSLSRRLVRTADTRDTTDTGKLALGLVTAFLRSDADCTDRYWALNSQGRLFKTDSSVNPLPNDSWRADTNTGTPTAARDMTIFERDTRGDSINRQQLFVTTDSDVVVLNDTGDTTWSSFWVTKQGHGFDSGLDTGVPHPIEYFPFRRIALIGSRNRIHTISRPNATSNDTSTVSRLTLPTELQVEHIFTTPDRAWILCSHRFRGEGMIIEWDGSSETYNNIYGAYSPYPLSGINYKGIPIVVNNKGMILEYTGRGFVPMIRNGQEIALPTIATPPGDIGSTGISARGMAIAEDGLIYINLAQPGSHRFRHSAGIWCLDPISGRFYAKYSIGGWGDTTFGDQEIDTPGALYSVSSAVSSRTFLIGGQFRRDLTPTTNSAIWTLDTPQSSTANRGYFVTQYIPASEVRNLWDTLWVHFRRFINTNNRIIVKARGVRPLMNSEWGVLEAVITWTSTTTFTVTLNSGDDAIAVGDEVEIMAGDNAGFLAHIDSFTGAHGALQTITLNEASPVSSTSTSRARFDRWKRLGAISSTTIYEAPLPIGIDSSFLQLKVEMRGIPYQMEIADLIVNYKTSVYSQK